jgi:hypothetical protein
MNLTQGIRLRYPAGWEKREDSSAAGFIVLFGSPQESPTDHFRENLTLIVEQPPLAVTLEQVVSFNTQNIPQQIPITSMTATQPTKLAGMLAYEVTYSGLLQNGLAGKWWQLYAVKNNKVYTVTYTAEAEKFEVFLPAMQDIIASLEIK